METFIIAEIGINHNGDLELAKKMIIAAKNAGVATNESREAEEALRNLGIDQEFIVRYHTDQEN